MQKPRRKEKVPPKEWWGCKRKEAFGKTGAVFLAKKRSKATKEDIRAYKCLFCEYWHIGHHSKKFDPVVIEGGQSFTLPPPDPDHLIQRVYEPECDYCWEAIPHSQDEHKYAVSLFSFREFVQGNACDLHK